jgi:cytochrome c oxidase subunit 2
MAAAPTDNFTLLVPQASTLAPQVDALFWSLLALSLLVSAAITIVIVWFCIKYRRGSPASRHQPAARNLRLEDVWIGVPLLIFIGLFAWAGVLYLRMFSPPPQALVVFVVAKQWMWKVQHRSGRREIDELHVPLGVPVRLIMTSQDVIHSFYVPAFRLKQDVLPGRYTALWFQATKLGTFALMCSEYCGTDHARMGGNVVVMPAERYQQWLAAAPVPADARARGAALFARVGCAGCHDAASGLPAPSLARVYGSQVQLADGRSVRVDDAFLRAALLTPEKTRIAGYDAVMPSYRGVLDAAQVDELVAWLRDGAASAPANGASGTVPR